MNIDEMKDRIARAEEIQRYTENRCEALEKENKTISRKANEAIADKLLITAKYNEVLNNLNQENDKLQKENAELKLKLEALEGQTPWKDIKDRSELIKENAELKAFKEKCKFDVSDICKEIEMENNLIKAKKLLKKLVTDFHNMDCVTVHIDKTIAEAEQFLKDSEVEK